MLESVDVGHFALTYFLSEELSAFDDNKATDVSTHIHPPLTSIYVRPQRPDIVKCEEGTEWKTIF